MICRKNLSIFLLQQVCILMMGKVAVCRTLFSLYLILIGGGRQHEQ